MNNPSEAMSEATTDTDRLDNFDIDQVELRVRPRDSELLSLSFPITVLASLRQVMAKRSISSVEALIRFYVGKGLRQDLSQLASEQAMEDATAKVLARRLGSEQEAAAAMEEIRQAIASPATTAIHRPPEP